MMNVGYIYATIWTSTRLLEKKKIFVMWNYIKIIPDEDIYSIEVCI